MRVSVIHTITLFLALLTFGAQAQNPVANDTVFAVTTDTIVSILPNDSLATPIDTAQVSLTLDELEDILSVCRTRLDSTSAALEKCTQLVSLQDDTLAQQALDIIKLHNETERLGKDVTRLQQLRDSLIVANSSYMTQLQEKNDLLQQTINAMNEREILFNEKENLYKEALNNNHVNTTKLEGEINAKNVSIEAKNTQIEMLQNSIREKDATLAQQQASYQKLIEEKEYFMAVADSLRERLFEADKKLIQINENLKYTEQRAKDAEAKIAAATSRKKKVSAIQGIALKFFRTPNWQLRPELRPKISITLGPDGEYITTETTEVVYKIVNRNAGKIEFDYITGASVMLVDLSPKDRPLSMVDTTSVMRKKKSKHDFLYSYSMGIYVGFGGSNLFKNFYAGLNFKFIDFFYIVGGINVCEYELLTGDIKEGDVLPSGWAISDQISKVWKVKPFIALAFDLDFLSYIKK